MNWVLDLDGVLWLAGQPIPGAARAVNALLDAGDDVVFVTNNSFPTVAEQEATLATHGIDAIGRVVNSASAVGILIQPGERILLCGGPGAREAIEAAGGHVVDAIGDHAPDAVDAVVVGFHRTFTYDVMRTAATAVRRGARLLATNDDATYPTPDGPIPGAGSILAGIERASGGRAVVAGKPHPPMVDLIRSRLGDQATVIGDRPDTDGRFARALGYRFALVLSGVTGPGDVPDPAPDDVASDLATLVARYLQAS